MFDDEWYPIAGVTLEPSMVYTEVDVPDELLAEFQAAEDKFLELNHKMLALMEEAELKKGGHE